jgi:hypothetical protein
MIWFLCKKCGKRHGRADNLASTLVFCECGQGNTVPWQSTTTPPAVPPAPPPRPLAPPRPQPFNDRDDRRPIDDHSAGDLLRRRKANVFRRRRPGFCINHDDVPTDKTCEDCKESFCSNCVVEQQGKTLCGPCKNFRIRGMTRPKNTPGLAVVALIVGLISGPVTFCMTLVGTGPKGSTAAAVALSLAGLVLPVGGMVVSWYALRQIESKPNLGGRGLAMTGATTSLVGALWCLTVAFLVIYRMTQG